MSLLSTVGMESPARFPEVAYNAIHAKVVAKFGSHGLYDHFGAGWNAVAYRFRDSSEAAARLDASLAAHGAAPKPEARYDQESALYSMFGAGFSSIEATFYALFAIGGLLDRASFPMGSKKELQAISVSSTTKAFAKAFPTDPIVGKLTAFAELDSYKGWRDARNILTHRTAPGRLMLVSFEDDEPIVEWKLNGLRVEPGFGTNSTDTLAELLHGLLIHLLDFARARI